jgi:hypothetical protein
MLICRQNNFSLDCVTSRSLPTIFFWLYVIKGLLYTFLSGRVKLNFSIFSWTLNLLFYSMLRLLINLFLQKNVYFLNSFYFNVFIDMNDSKGFNSSVCYHKCERWNAPLLLCLFFSLLIPCVKVRILICNS